MANWPVAILAGGLATRLRPATNNIPKALLSVAGEPFLVHQLRLLRSEGFRKIVLCVGHLGELIENPEVSATQAKSLSRASSEALDALRNKLEDLLKRMQTPAARKGMESAFNADPAALGKAAVEAGRRRRVR